MVRHVNNSGAIKTVFELYMRLREKERTQEEEQIFNFIKKAHEEQFENSVVYFYKINKKRAKVKYDTFNSRCYNGWDKEKALTTKPKQKQKTVDTKREDEKIRAKLLREETEQDIIRFLDNGLALNRRQLKYIENNPAFAEKLKNRKVEC
ncbi:hypothetical protein G6W75_10025 [Staphylococcus sciuri]|uniref:hypothetical protein n=1 Tax=Mammaliicoccus sciuri TaxID=1296 RepID=UPI0013E97BB9|nr:hypothetical protein [Mammaliicoccus sciuri]NGX76427.1 hypothetical protein [Mammaliicoccus sciuri]